MRRHGKVVRHSVVVYVKRLERVKVRVNGKVRVEWREVVREVVDHRTVRRCPPLQTISAPVTTPPPASPTA